MADPRIERTRTAVLDAASDLLAEAGVVGFNVDAVARRSGVARTTIYRHWPDANELLFVTNMTAGHQGSSGRFGAVSIEARVMAWLLTLAQ